MVSKKQINFRSLKQVISYLDSQNEVKYQYNTEDPEVDKKHWIDIWLREGFIGIVKKDNNKVVAICYSQEGVNLLYQVFNNRINYRRISGRLQIK